MPRIVATATIAIVILAAPLTAQCLDAWQSLDRPAARYDSAMAFDDDRGVIVLFGGSNALDSQPGSEFGDTWEYDGQRWIQRDLPGPSPRRSHVMAYDSARGVVVLVGGAADQLFADVWEYDGDHWLQSPHRFPASPPVESAMVFDAARGECVLYGGEFAPSNATTYLWNGQQWRVETPATGPGRRGNHAMAYDSIRQKVVLFGGNTQGAPGSDLQTWEWDGVEWSLRTIAGPPGRSELALAFDPVAGETVLFGGFRQITPFELADTWVWNGEYWRERLAPGIVPRQAAAMAFSTQAGGVVLFGGADSNNGGPPFLSLGDQLLWNGQSWSGGETLPPQQSLPALAFDEPRGAMVMIEGMRQDQQSLDQTWERVGRLWSQRAGNAPGAASLAVAAAYDPDDGHVLAVVPNSFNFSIGETWRWNGSDWSLLDDASLPGFSSGIPIAMAYDESRHQVMLVRPNGTAFWSGAAWVTVNTSTPIGNPAALFFDRVSGAPLLISGTSTFRWNGMAWISIATAPLMGAPRAAVFDVERNVGVLVTRGDNPNGSQVHEWDGVGWTQVPGRGPDVADFGLGYDSALQRTVLFGGRRMTGRIGNATYEWDGTNWTAVDGLRPAPRAEHAIAYDRLRRRTLLFGGRNSETTQFSLLSDSWEFDGEQWTPMPGATPTARTNAGIAVDEARGVTVLWGGATDAAPSRAVYEWDGQTWSATSENIQGPTPPSSPSLVYDALRQSIVYWDGTRLWTWDGAVWDFVPLAPGSLPPPDIRMAWDSYNLRLIGYSPTSRRLWELFDDTWEMSPVTGPSVVGRIGFAFDSGRGRPVVVGSEGTLAPVKAFEFTGAAWVQRGFDADFGPRSDFVVTYDTARAEIVLHGGRNVAPSPDFFYGDLWRLASGAPMVASDPVDVTVAFPGAAAFEMVAEPAHGITYQWFRNDQPLVDDGRISGAGTTRLQIAQTVGDDAGLYRCRVTSDCGSNSTLAAELIVTGAPCTSDLTGDRQVDLADLAIVLASFGTAGGADPEDGDLDADGDVDVQDLAMLLAHFGVVCP